METLMDYINELNWIAVLVATMAGFIVSAIWYSVLFGKPWQKAAGLKDKDVKNAGSKPLVLGFVTLFITAAAMGVLLPVLALTTALQGASFGILAGLAFIATNKAMTMTFEQRSPTLFWINVGGDTITLAVIGAVLAVWR